MSRATIYVPVKLRRIVPTLSMYCDPNAALVFDAMYPHEACIARVLRSAPCTVPALERVLHRRVDKINILVRPRFINEIPSKEVAVSQQDQRVAVKVVFQS